MSVILTVMMTTTPMALIIDLVRFDGPVVDATALRLSLHRIVLFGRSPLFRDTEGCQKRLRKTVPLQVN